MQQVFASWSGGKDSCLACYRASVSDLKVCYLLNMITEDGKWSWSHRQPTQLLKVQSQAIGIPLVQRRTTRDSYETEFKDMLHALKREGIIAGVFGDIDFEEHRQWIDRVCSETGVIPHLPLWGQAQEQILRDFINSGFEAIMVTARADLFDEEWLGRKIDLDFLSYLSELDRRYSIQLCGEAGEYHTFVADGPLFDQRIEILETNTVLREGYWFLEISEYSLRTK